MANNPFTPTFGAIPAHMAGREEVIEELMTALRNGPGDPNLATIFSGARGTGKTALLTYLAEAANGEGWITASVSALPGMLEEIVQQSWRAASHLTEKQGRTKLAGIKIADVVELGFEEEAVASPTWRIRMSDVFDALEPTETGLLITVDEVRQDLDEMVQLASSFQHFVREGRRIALFMAGLPMNISALLQDKSASFLRRASYHELGMVDDYDIEQALVSTAGESGRVFTPDALERAVSIIGGYPYMMQLIGYRAWNASSSDMVLTEADVQAGAQHARRDMQRKIFDTTFKELSKGDVAFLEAMLEDNGPSELAKVAARMGKKSNYASQYKRRLIEQGVLLDIGQGNMRIAIPLFKEYLQGRLR